MNDSGPLTKADLETIRDTARTIARLTVLVENIQEMTRDNHNAIRGVGDDLGMLGRIARLEDLMQPMMPLVSKIDDTLIISISDIRQVQADLAAHKALVDELQRDYEFLKKTHENSPSIIWLLRNKTKEFIIVTGSIVAFVVIVSELMIHPQLDKLWFFLWEVLKKYYGV